MSGKWHWAAKFSPGSVLESVKGTTRCDKSREDFHFSDCLGIVHLKYYFVGQRQRKKKKKKKSAEANHVGPAEGAHGDHLSPLSALQCFLSAGTQVSAVLRLNSGKEAGRCFRALFPPHTSQHHLFLTAMPACGAAAENPLFRGAGLGVLTGTSPLQHFFFGGGGVGWVGSLSSSHLSKAPHPAHDGHDFTCHANLCPAINEANGSLGADGARWALFRAEGASSPSVPALACILIRARRDVGVWMSSEKLGCSLTGYVHGSLRAESNQP